MKHYIIILGRREKGREKVNKIIAGKPQNLLKNCTNCKCKGSFLGWSLGLSCRFLFCLVCFSGPSKKYLSSRRTLFQFIIQQARQAGSRAGSHVS